jgi:diaminohydroxyphosphoribosylaminopyrimidine deaminase / 5-amino-6-(5-phosphoribosylamino)uracil reductase
VGVTQSNRSDQADLRHLRRALRLAERGLGLAPPNPPVGAVVVRGGIVGEGWHEGPGTPHAEVAALRDAGPRAEGATVYVTLEPCAHQGRTPPCVRALVDAGVRRVVAPIADPNPVVDGRGFEALRRAGVEVVVGPLREEAERLVAGFAKHVRTGRPFVTLKMASSLDGKVAARDGSSRWITGPQARRDVHRLRAGAGAVVVGAGTALADDPALTVRLDGYRGRPPLRVLLDATGRVPAGGRLFDGSAPTVVATTASAPREAASAWAAAGAEVLVLDAADRAGAGAAAASADHPGTADHPGARTAPRPEVSLDALLDALGKREVQDVLIEGGPSVAWSAVRDGVVDRLVLYLAPKLIGGADAAGVLAGEGVPGVGDALALEIESVGPVGPDLKVVAVVHRDR